MRKMHRPCGGEFDWKIVVLNGQTGQAIYVSAKATYLHVSQERSLDNVKFIYLIAGHYERGLTSDGASAEI